jgi:heme exporter protein CcmD
MNHWPFIIAAYGIVATGMALLIVASWRAMRRAERAVEDMRR